MRVLIQGTETIERIDAIIAKTRIKSPEKIQALKDHFCRGIHKRGAAALNGLDPDKFSEFVTNFHLLAERADRKATKGVEQSPLVSG